MANGRRKPAGKGLTSQLTSAARPKDDAMFRLTTEPIDYHALTEQVRRPGCGAVVTFLGTVRDLTGGRTTIALDYEAYPGMAEKKLGEIEQETRVRWPVGDLVMVHRLGHLEIGEVSVAVAVSCPHRDQAFEACRYAIDRLKEIVPIWKKENWGDGTTEWVHPGTDGKGKEARG
jgi:molybdopterin synthase catalytic subunit